MSNNKDVEMKEVNEHETMMEQLEEMIVVDPQAAIHRLREVIKNGKTQVKEGEQDPAIYQEQAIYALMRAYAATNNADALVAMLKELRSSFDSYSKSKRENIVKNVFDRLASIPNTQQKQIDLCREYIEYFKKENRSFLKQRFEVKLASLLVDEGKYSESLSLLKNLSSEVKKLDDKLMLVEIYLSESRAQFKLGNVAKSRASLTAARTNANAIYVAVNLQAEIDLQSGILNMSDKDYRTSYSYFYESHEAYMSMSSNGKKGIDKKSDLLYWTRAKQCLVYMLLSKVMNDNANEIGSIMNFKNSIPFLDEPEVKSFNEIASSVKQRSLESFTNVLDKYQEVVSKDVLVSEHLEQFKSDLLEKNLCRLLQPYSRVEVSRIAELIKLPKEAVLSKLSQMILDKKFNGILDQGTGLLIVYDEPETDVIYKNSLQLLETMNGVVGNLTRRAKQLQAQ